MNSCFALPLIDEAITEWFFFARDSMAALFLKYTQRFRTGAFFKGSSGLEKQKLDKKLI